jgi:hypothetical protein
VTLVRVAPPSRRLLALLREAHDDGQPALDVLHDPPALVVRRADGTDLSRAEEVEVRALLAADAAEEID